MPPTPPKTFSEIFRIREAANSYIPWAIEGTTYIPAGAAVAQAMKDDLDRRGLELDLKKGPLNSDGSMSAIFLTPEISGGVVRIGMIDAPAESAIVLQPAAAFHYKRPDAPEGLQVHVMPFAPDVGEVTTSDIINTLRVLKTENLLTKLSDISPGQFVYLRGQDGNLLCYPDTLADEAMCSKPIAFIRDINAIRASALEDPDGTNADTAAQFPRAAREVLCSVKRSFDDGVQRDGKIALKAFDDAADEMEHLRALGLKPKLDLTQQGILLEGAEALKLYNMRGQMTVDDLPPAPAEAVAAAAAAQAPVIQALQAGLKAAGVDTSPTMLQGDFKAAAEAPATAANEPAHQRTVKAYPSA